MRKFIVSITAILLMAGFSIAEDYNLDKAHSKVGFAVDHMVVATVDGKFNDFDVALSLDLKDLSTFNLKAVIKIASVDTDHEKRDGHLRSADFFDAENHPDMTFISSKLVKQDNKYVSLGTLTIRGVSKEIELPFTVKGPITDGYGNSRIGIAASTIINRQEYGVQWSKSINGGGLVVSDEVEIKISAEFTVKR